jgi:hypothetical protein
VTGGVGGQVIGGGIAGVASTGEGEGVKKYNDRTIYQEWEFIFDPAKVKIIPNPNQTGLGGTPVNQLGSTPGQQNGPQGTSPVGGSNPTPGVIMNGLGTGNRSPSQ